MIVRYPCVLADPSHELCRGQSADRPRSTNTRRTLRTHNKSMVFGPAQTVTGKTVTSSNIYYVPRLFSWAKRLLQVSGHALQVLKGRVGDFHSHRLKCQAMRVGEEKEMSCNATSVTFAKLSNFSLNCTCASCTGTLESVYIQHTAFCSHCTLHAHNGCRCTFSILALT